MVSGLPFSSLANDFPSLPTDPEARFLFGGPLFLTFQSGQDKVYA
jgi:hypothetical protein